GHLAVPALLSVFPDVSGPPEGTPLVPYTTLFRSGARTWVLVAVLLGTGGLGLLLTHPNTAVMALLLLAVLTAHGAVRERRWVLRSEEHTSELQSRENLVCRLLLDKNKPLRRAGLR